MFAIMLKSGATAVTKYMVPHFKTEKKKKKYMSSVGQQIAKVSKDRLTT